MRTRHEKQVMRSRLCEAGSLKRKRSHRRSRLAANTYTIANAKVMVDPALLVQLKPCAPFLLILCDELLPSRGPVSSPLLLHGRRMMWVWERVVRRCGRGGWSLVPVQERRRLVVERENVPAVVASLHAFPVASSLRNLLCFLCFALSSSPREAKRMERDSEIGVL
jgi:hypothetical protein